MNDDSYSPYLHPSKVYFSLLTFFLLMYLLHNRQIRHRICFEATAKLPICSWDICLGEREIYNGRFITSVELERNDAYRATQNYNEEYGIRLVVCAKQVLESVGLQMRSMLKLLHSGFQFLHPTKIETQGLRGLFCKKHRRRKLNFTYYAYC